MYELSIQKPQKLNTKHSVSRLSLPPFLPTVAFPPAETWRAGAKVAGDSNQKLTTFHTWSSF